MKKIQDAAPMWNELIIAFQDFEATISVELVSQWHQAVELWEENSNAPNPFKVEKQCNESLLSYFVYSDIAFDSGL